MEKAIRICVAKIHAMVTAGSTPVSPVPMIQKPGTEAHTPTKYSPLYTIQLAHGYIVHACTFCTSIALFYVRKLYTYLVCVQQLHSKVLEERKKKQ